jgi:uncharacterized protein
MGQYHEPIGELPDKDRDIIRALISLKEEIEAIDWYHQRQATCSDTELKKVLIHNRDEEIEHAVMNMEWLRRNMETWDEVLKTYLFTTKSIVDIEEGEEEDEDNNLSDDLGIGNID